jgi:putative DNA primase/helicase
MARGNIEDEALNRWEEILPMLGVHDDFLSNRHGPCPACGGTDRFRFDDKDGRGTFFCSHCGAGNGVTLLMRVNQWEFKQAAEEIRRVLGNPSVCNRAASAPVRQKKTPEQTAQEQEKTKAKLRAFWRGARAVQKDDVVFKYLWGRGLKLDNIPKALRTHLRMSYYEPGKKRGEYTKLGNFPCMLALVSDPQGNPTTIWRTYLDQSGKGKANVTSPKKPVSVPGKGSAIRLFEPVNGVLGVGEGIETVLAAHILYNIPVWAGMCADIMKGIVFPDDVKEVVIFADNDPPDSQGMRKGIEAAKELAQRLRDEGRKVTIKMPKVEGTDYLDVLNSIQRH